MRELSTTVVSCTASIPPPPAAGKKTKKAVLAPSLPNGPILEIVLHDTVIFPEGGGQPTDIGFIKTTDDRVWNVLQVKRHGGHAVHFVQVSTDDVNEASTRVFIPGANVTVALGSEGFDRRYDHVRFLAIYP